MNVQQVYAAWNKNKKVRKRSTSGGMFTLLAESILRDGGVISGVKWMDYFSAGHYMTDNSADLPVLNGSKYVQSNTADIYSKVKSALDDERKVLFSGTPCQNHALKMFLGKEYSNLYQIDFVCHGVPSYEMLKRYLSERSYNGLKTVSNVRFRYKNPYWDYCFVKVDFTDGTHYMKYTVDDSYFTIFNIGYSLRDICRHCKYTSTNRYGDITLADFWGYRPDNFKMRDFNKGTSLVLINSEKGQFLFDSIDNENLVCEKSTIDRAIRGNKALKMPFSPPQNDVDSFWIDYESGMTVDALCKKYVPDLIALPNLLWLRRLKAKYFGLFEKR
jgi:coenzyme F420-reducing hydrogenase beta subunit